MAGTAQLLPPRRRLMWIILLSIFFLVAFSFVRLQLWTSDNSHCWPPSSSSSSSSSSSFTLSSSSSSSSSSSFTSAAEPFHVPWNAFVSTPSGRAQVIAVSQDHRAWPNVSALPAPLRPLTFHNLTTRRPNPSLRVFQLHLALTIHAFNHVRTQVPVERTFQAVELWWTDHAPGRERVEVKLPAHDYVIDMPLHASYRYGFRPDHLELIVRCAFFVPEGAWLTRPDMRFAVFAAEEVVFFPLDRVLHFPTPAPLLSISTADTALAGRKPFPSAPWAGRSRRGLRPIVRATGDDARVRVGAWITKKFTWTADDDLWLLWTLDVVGVDHVVLELASVDLDIKAVEQRLAGHPGLLERVTIVAVDAPGRNDKVTYCYLQELLVWDGFVRFQADFDFVFLVDTDEFVQLFSPAPPYERVDVKTFIARNRKRLETGGHAYMYRLRVGRTQANDLVEPGLPAFLRGVLARDGAQFYSMAMAGRGGWDWQGKSLFHVNGTVQPYLHFSVGYPKDMWPPREAHVLHIRRSGRKEWANGTLAWWLTQLVHHPAQPSQEG